MIIGAGNTGEMLVRDMARNGFANFYPIGFLDDDRTKAGSYVHGVKVFGKLEKLSNVIVLEKVEAVVIAIPSLNHKTLRRLYDAGAGSRSARSRWCQGSTISTSRTSTEGLEDISIEDLIGRQMHLRGLPGHPEFP